MHSAIRVRMTFTPESLHAQLVLNDVNVYGFEQKHDQMAALPRRLNCRRRAGAGLFAFGVADD